MTIVEPVEPVEVELKETQTPTEGTANERIDEGSALEAQIEHPVHRQSSMSEVVEMSGVGWNAPWYLNWFEILFRMKDPSTGNYLPEATGWAMDAAARGPFFQIGTYMGSSILRLASLAAGCPSSGGCTKTLYGLQPSSLLTLSSTVVGVVAAIFMPLFGAVVDHTRHRKLVGVISGFITVLTTGMQIGISVQPNNWLYIYVVDAIQSFALLVHVTSVFAYLPDLTLDHSVLPKYTAHFNIRQFLSMLTVGGIVILIGQVQGNSSSLQANVNTARNGAAIAFTYGAVFFGYAWTFLFRQRPALSKVPEGSTLITAGFKQVYRTSRKIWNEYRALKWFMISLLWSPEQGSGVVQSITITFLTVVLRFSTLDIAKGALLLMVGTVVGSGVSPHLCRWLNPLNSYRYGMVMLGIAIAVSAAYLDGPSKFSAVFGFAISWGFFMGWTYPTQRVLFVTLIPKGQETEMMGLFSFVGQILGWLPPLIFTIMNEKKVNMRWGFGLISVFCFFAIICTLPMGNYQNAVSQVALDSEEKFKEVLDAASKHENRSSLRKSIEKQPIEGAVEVAPGS